MVNNLYLYKTWVVRDLIPNKLMGVYRLYKYLQGECKLIYVGRSDTDIKRRLCNHPYLEEADYFEYETIDSPDKGFLLEAAYYHSANNGLKNIIHPAIPHGSNITCPFCEYGKYIKA